MTVVMQVQGDVPTGQNELQWVHGPMTVVMQEGGVGLALSPWASMGPRSDDRGYEPHRRRHHQARPASMGPRSDDRGYAGKRRYRSGASTSFNGSTVR